MQTHRLVIPGMITLGLILVGLIIFRRPLLSAWYTNLGAVKMAKVELADFPTEFGMKVSKQIFFRRLNRFLIEL